MIRHRNGALAAAISVGLASAAIACSQPVSAQTITIRPLDRPDPSGITVPDMTALLTKSDMRRFDDYYYFYKTGVSYERAFADLDQCRMYSVVALVGGPAPPNVMPLGSQLPLDYQSPPFVSGLEGLAGFLGGAIIRATVVAEVMDDLKRGTERRCMMWKRYGRYGTSRALWKQIEAGTEAEKLARLAMVASGSAPKSEALEP